MSKKSKILVIVLSSVSALVLVFFCGLGIYASDYRELDPDYQYVLDSDTVVQYDNMVHYVADSNIGIVFYQGGRVDYLAYAPLMAKFQAEGINCFLIDTPYNMACFGINRADDIIAEYTSITNWYVAGHSLGGVAANMYATSNSDSINGVIFMGIYLSADYDVNNTITIYGSNDLRVGDSVTYTTNVYVIEGGNHAQFGNYGANSGDGVATISDTEQQDITVQLVLDWMVGRNS